MIEDMEHIARKWHAGQLRKDGKTPYIEHPKAVAELMGKWGFGPQCHGWAVAVAWGHDLIEETPPEMRKEVEHDILCSACGLLDERETILQAIRLLSRDKTVFPVKADYIRHVAETASQPVLAVKIADRICNTRDFLKLEGAGIEKARHYFAAGAPLFDHLGKTQFPCQRLHEDIEVRIRDEIEAARSEIGR
jgi:(p)ppGpp synthase/HD superfamily hydrolase